MADIVSVASTIAGSISAVIAAIALIISSHQLRINSQEMKKNEIEVRVRLFLTIRELLSKYEEVYSDLYEGKYSQKNSGPGSLKEWSRVYSYIGILEYCYSLFKHDPNGKNEFLKAYRTRIRSIVVNDVIMNKLKEDKERWKDSLELCNEITITNEILK